MKTAERKQLLFQRLLAVNDERLLEEIETLLDRRCPDDILYFSPELKEKVDNVLEQMKRGEVITTEEMRNKLSQWSGE